MSKNDKSASVTNKCDLIDKIHLDAKITKIQSKNALEAIIRIITSELQKGGKVNIIGFGAFEARQREARMGRNPQTGESIKIAASRLPAFKPGKTLKESLKSMA